MAARTAATVPAAIAIAVVGLESFRPGVGAALLGVVHVSPLGFTHARASKGPRFREGVSFRVEPYDSFAFRVRLQRRQTREEENEGEPKTERKQKTKKKIDSKGGHKKG